jgi:hypothetical protein
MSVSRHYFLASCHVTDYGGFIETGDTDMATILRTTSNQIEVEVYEVNREHGFVGGSKVNKQRHGCDSLFSVYFRNDEPVLVDGTGRPHPKLVLAAASAAWRNVA